MNNVFVVSLLKTLRKAGEKVLEIYQRNFDVYEKDDKSPLTEADLVSNKIISNFLKKTNIPIISEESRNVPYEKRKIWRRFWLLDPLDGTKEFIKKNGDFTIQVALIDDYTPTLSIIYWPVEGVFYFAVKDIGSFKIKKDVLDRVIDLQNLIKNSKRLSVNNDMNDKLTIVVSRSHMDKETEDMINRLSKTFRNVEIVSKGSSLKFCLVAEGKAHIYLRKTPLMEWDLAPGYLIVKEAGGYVVTWQGENVKFNTPSLVIEGIKSFCCPIEFN